MRTIIFCGAILFSSLGFATKLSYKTEIPSESYFTSPQFAPLSNDVFMAAEEKLKKINVESRAPIAMYDFGFDKVIGDLWAIPGHPDKILVSSILSSHLEYWDLDSMVLISSFSNPFRTGYSFEKVRFSNDGRLAVVSCESEVAILELETGLVISRYNVTPGWANRIEDMILRNGDTELWIVSSKGIHRINLQLNRIDVIAESWVNGLFSPDGIHLIARKQGWNNCDNLYVGKIEDFVNGNPQKFDVRDAAGNCRTARAFSYLPDGSLAFILDNKGDLVWFAPEAPSVIGRQSITTAEDSRGADILISDSGESLLYFDRSLGKGVYRIWAILPGE